MHNHSLCFSFIMKLSEGVYMFTLLLLLVMLITNPIFLSYSGTMVIWTIVELLVSKDIKKNKTEEEYKKFRQTIKVVNVILHLLLIVALSLSALFFSLTPIRISFM